MGKVFKISALHLDPKDYELLTKWDQDGTASCPAFYEVSLGECRAASEQVTYHALTVLTNDLVPNAHTASCFFESPSDYFTKTFLLVMADAYSAGYDAVEFSMAAPVSPDYYAREPKIMCCSCGSYGPFQAQILTMAGTDPFGMLSVDYNANLSFASHKMESTLVCLRCHSEHKLKIRGSV